MAAAQRGRRAFRVLDALDQHVDAIAAPEQFAIEDHGGDAEHAERLRLVDNAVVLRARRSLGIGLEIPGRPADRGDHIRYRGEIVDLQIVAPEPPEYRVVIGPEEAVTLGE